MNARRLLATALAALLAALALSPATGTSAASVSAEAQAAPPEPSSVVTDWEKILIRTVYTENATPIPTGVLYLGFTSMAMYDAVKRAHRHHGSPTAAVATAAHDVLLEYYPASEANLATDLATTLDAIPPSTYKWRGRVAGAAAAADMIEQREDDGRDDASIVYDRPPGPGVWQPPAGGAMLAPWLGFVDKLVDKRPIWVDGPDPITSWEYAMDYHEEKRLGRIDSTYRTAFQTDTAHFFNSNSATMVGEALIRLLEENPMALKDTARLFATMHGAMTDAVITCWRLKYQGFWRPFQAIAGAADDGNPATVPDPTWVPLIANPPYADYVTGHGCLTGPAIETVRHLLGEETELTLISANPLTTDADRTYSTLTEIEFDAFHSRIWGGLHFRDAMEDGYRVGHVAAQRVLSRLN